MFCAVSLWLRSVTTDQLIQLKWLRNLGIDGNSGILATPGPIQYVWPRTFFLRAIQIAFEKFEKQVQTVQTSVNANTYH